MHTVPTTPPSTSLIPTYMGEPMRPAPRRLHLVTDESPATVELLIPTKPPLPRRLSPRRPSWRMTLRGEGAATGVVIAGLFAAGELAYAITHILGGAR